MRYSNTLVPIQWVRALLILALATTLAACGDSDDGGGTDGTGGSMTDTGTGGTMTDADNDTSMTGGTSGGAPAISAPANVVFTYFDTQGTNPTRAYRVSSTDAEGGDGLQQDALTSLNDAIDCSNSQCWISDNNRFFLRSDSRTNDLRIGDVTDGTPSENLMLVASNIVSLAFSGDKVAYVADQNQAFMLDLSGDSLATPQRIVATTTTEAPDGGIALSRDANALFVYRLYSNRTLGVNLVDLSAGMLAETELFRLGVPSLSGDQAFSTSNPIAVSPDGNTAVMLLDGLSRVGNCDSDTTCQSAHPDARCIFPTDEAGSQNPIGLCGVRQVQLLVFSLANTEDLGKECLRNSDCDPLHKCDLSPFDITDPENLPTTCQPKSLILAPSAPRARACEQLMAGPQGTLPIGAFSSIVPKLRFNANGQLLFLGRRDCNELNISVDSMMALSTENIDNDLVADMTIAELGTVIEGGYTTAHGEMPPCSDGSSFSYGECSIEITNFETDDEGRTLALIGSATNDASGAEIWLFDSSNTKYPVTKDLFFDVRSLSVITE